MITQPTAPETAPFVIEHRQHPEAAGHFTPEAVLLLSPQLRTSGLLAVLPDEAARTLLAALSFLTPDGRISPSIVELTEALQVSQSAMRKRIRHLSALSWHGEPLARVLPRESGLDAVMPSRQLVGERQAPSLPAPVVNLPIPAGRDEVLARSREAYARPRIEVERIVAEQLGHTPEELEESPEGEVRRRLIALGVPREQVETLLASHPLKAIAQQLDWLPHRKPKNAARLIVAAIEGNYEPPVSLRTHVAAGEEEHAE